MNITVSKRRNLLSSFTDLAAGNNHRGGNATLSFRLCIPPTRSHGMERPALPLYHPDADGSTWFTMDDWRLYSTNDMVN